MSPATQTGLWPSSPGSLLQEGAGSQGWGLQALLGGADWMALVLTSETRPKGTACRRPFSRGPGTLHTVVERMSE